MYTRRNGYHPRIRFFVLWWVSGIFGVLSIDASYAAELIMTEEIGCIYCRKFNREIAPAYPNTIEGKRAPLRRVDINKPWPENLSHITPERLTPTFILVDENREYARLRGYPGDEYFWFLLSEMLDDMDEFLLQNSGGN